MRAACGAVRVSLSLECDNSAIELNRGSLFEPPFETRRRPAGRDHARRRPRLPRTRLRRRRHARDRRRGRPLAREPVSLLPRQGRAVVLLPGSLARPAAGRSRGGAPRPAADAGAASRRRAGARPGAPRRSRGIGGASRGRRAPAEAAGPHRRQARSLRARRSDAGRGRHSHRRAAQYGSDDRHPRVSRRAQLDRALVPAGRRAVTAAGRGARRRLRRRRIDV